ncbi:MAG TPA: TolC family protein [Holophagaceae bacterium]
MLGVMRTRALLPPLALLLLAGACARPPRAALDPARTLADLQRPAALPPGDLATVLTFQAWKDHPELDLARAELATARAGIRTAGAIPNPSFGFGATKAEGVPQPWTLTYGLTFPVELGGKRRLRIRQAELQVQDAQLAVADTAWRLRTGVRGALVDWRQARESAALADRSAALWAGLLALQDRRLALGGIAAPERAATAQEAQRAVAARLAAQAALRRAEAALALAAGVPEPALAPRLAAEPPPDLAPEAAPPPPAAEALIHRLDVRRVLLAWDRNETALDQELAQRVPNLQLGPGYSFDQGVKKWTLGLALDLPLFDRRQGPIAEAVARRDVIKAQLRQVEAQALAAAGLAEARLAAAQAALAAHDRALADSESRLATARRAFALGGLDRGALAAAELEALQARGLAVDAWAEAARARLAVEDAFQRPLDPAERPYPFDPAQGVTP